MSGLLPPVVARLIADTKEYTAKMTEAQAKMTEFGAASKSSAGLFGLSTKQIAFGAAGVAAAVGVYAVEAAHKFQDGLDKIKNQAGLTTVQMEELGKSIRSISVVTGVTTSDLETAALTVEQAGIRGAAATKLLTDAAKASVITNASVVDTTKAIVAAQTLQIAKGMEVNKLTGILIAGSKGFVGGLAAEEQMLQGRVGVALANYGLSLKQIIPLGQIFAKVNLPTRSVAAFANALSNLQKSSKDAKGNLTTYAQGLDRYGLSQTKLASDFRKGNLVGVLAQIKQAVADTGQPLSVITKAVFGTASGTASVLIKNLKDLAAAQQNLNGAGAGTLKTGWSNVVTQLGPQLNILKTQVQDLVLALGQVLLPKVLVGVQWANKFITDTRKFFETHPIVIKAIVQAFKFEAGPFGALFKDIGWIINKVIPSSNTPKTTSPFSGPNSRLVINNKATVRSNSGKW
jgi:TP901 family phage tail tape measure protein